ncbi:YjiH family protein [Tissierella creatinini]|nr:YjiH family protein [Tissierella creatinini]TJX60080.1 YjiH family protein [Soehngenia saccharolytica]
MDKPILSVSEIKYQNLDLNDITVLDSFSLSKEDHRKGLIKSAIMSIIALYIFFIPVTFNGKTDMVFGIIVNTMKALTGNAGLWFITIIVALLALLGVYGKYIAKSGKIHDYFSTDSMIHPILYLLGAFYFMSYTLSTTMGVQLPEIIVGPDTAGVVVPSIAVSVFWIILVSSITMPFLLNYGLVDLIGSVLEPLMRPIWKLPGRAAINALASFVSSSTVGVLMSNKLFRKGVYTEKEAVLVITGFSDVSVGFAYVAVSMAGLGDKFILVYGTAILLNLTVSAFIVRIPPFSKKRDIYIDGRVQTAQELVNARPKGNVLKAALARTSKKANTAPNLLGEMSTGVREGVEVMPKVVAQIAAIGITALIVAETTPLFQVLGKAFIPLLNLLRIPNADLIAASFPIGIAEMLLPVLLLQKNLELLDMGTRYLVTVVSLVQVIFFSETIPVMLSSRVPIKLWELVVGFLERTILAIIFGSVLMRILF